MVKDRTIENLYINRSHGEGENCYGERDRLPETAILLVQPATLPWRKAPLMSYLF